MKTQTQRIRVVKNGPTYLREGEEYTLTRAGKSLHFVHDSGCGTYEQVGLWNALVSIARVVIEVLD